MLPVNFTIQQLQYLLSFQRIMELDASPIPQQLIFIDQAGFNLAKRRRGRNIGKRAIIEVPGQRGGNVTICAAMSHNGVLQRLATLGPYNTAHLLHFLNTLHENLFQPEQRRPGDPEQLMYVLIWDNMSIHRAAQVHNQFHDHPRFIILYLQPYSPFLNPIEEPFSVCGRCIIANPHGPSSGNGGGLW